MSDPSEPPIVPVRLVLEFGGTVEMDGSAVYDPTAERLLPAVTLRMPPHRAAWSVGCWMRTRA